MKICILTLGCKVNTYESEVIKSQFLSNQDKIVDLKDNPDVVVINTCTVTNQADAKSRKLIRQAKKNNPMSVIVVCGCSAEHHQADLQALGIDILIGNKDKTKIVDYVKEYWQTKGPICHFYDLNKYPFEDMVIDNYTTMTRAFVKIQDGCNNFCTYCAIPYVRGRIRNKDLNTAYEEIKGLVQNGFKEIVLTGIHTGSYGSGTDYNLITLIKMVSALPNLKRIRISSIEITEITDEFLEELKTNPKICDHLHIPLQSGADAVLKAMNRKYDLQTYQLILNKIRMIRPNINITTDIIVGFPTETAADFSVTLKNAEQFGFGKIHVFPFSKRNGTVAASLKNIVSDQTKKTRVQELLSLSDQLENLYYQKFIGQTLSVLIEEDDDGQSIGHTSNYMKVILDSKLTNNEEYACLITQVDKNSVNGQLV